MKYRSCVLLIIISLGYLNFTLQNDVLYMPTEGCFRIYLPKVENFCALIEILTLRCRPITTGSESYVV